MICQFHQVALHRRIPVSSQSTLSIMKVLCSQDRNEITEIFLRYSEKHAIFIILVIILKGFLKQVRLDPLSMFSRINSKRSKRSQDQ